MGTKQMSIPAAKDGQGLVAGNQGMCEGQEMAQGGGVYKD